jgi:uncharacterized protein
MSIATYPTKTSTTLVGEFYQALARGDVQTAKASLSPDVALHVPGTHPLAGTHRGHDGFFAFLGAIRGLTATGEQIEILDVLEGDAYVAVYCRVRATRPGKTPLDNHTLHLLRLQEDRIAEVWLHNRDDVSVSEFWS